MAFPRLQELAAMQNSNNLPDTMSVHIQRKINDDLQFAAGLSQLWEVLYSRVDEHRLLIAELNVFGGPLALQCAKFHKQLSQTEVLKMLEIRKTIAEVHIQVHKKINFLIVMRYKKMVLKTICIDCWFKAQPGHGMSFATRPKPDREVMWVHCQMHRSRMGHTITNRGLPATGTTGLVVGQVLGRGKTTIPVTGDYLISLVVRSTIAAGLAGGSIVTRSITVPEVIDDYMSPQRTDSSEDETEPPAARGTRSLTSKSLTK
ncbi:hypothetical protein Tco_1553418 [Tanacetum coccineum]